MYWIYTIQCIYIYIRRRAIFTYELHRCILYLSLCIWYEYMFACTRKLWICLAGWWFQHTYEDKLVIGLHIRTSQALSSWILDICAPLCPPLKSVFKSVPPRRKKEAEPIPGADSSAKHQKTDWKRQRVQRITPCPAPSAQNVGCATPNIMVLQSAQTVSFMLKSPFSQVTISIVRDTYLEHHFSHFFSTPYLEHKPTLYFQ